jgi:hypothetical protein
LTGQVLDVASLSPISGVHVYICAFGDTGCTMPVGQGQSDPTGNWQAPVSGLLGTDSFAEFTSPPGTSPGIVPELKFIGYPVSEPRAPFAGLPGVGLVGTLKEYQDALAPTGIQWDPALGWIAFLVYDCRLLQAVGVSVTIEGPNGPDVRPYYVQGGSYNFSATATDDAFFTGQGGFLNVQPGQYTLTAKVAALGGKTLGTGHVFVQAGARSVLYLYPTP